MVVCSCRWVSDRVVHGAIAAGASTLEEIGAVCAAGGACGGCRPALQRLLDNHGTRLATPRSAVA